VCFGVGSRGNDSEFYRVVTSRNHSIMIAVGGSFIREKLNDIVTLTRARDVKAKEKSVHT